MKNSDIQDRFDEIASHYEDGHGSVVRARIIALLNFCLEGRGEDLSEEEIFHYGSAIGLLWRNKKRGDEESLSWLNLCMHHVDDALSHSQTQKGHYENWRASVAGISHADLMRELYLLQADAP